MKDNTSFWVKVFFHPLFLSGFADKPHDTPNKCSSCCAKCFSPAIKVIAMIIAVLLFIVTIGMLVSVIFFGTTFEEPTQLFFFYRTSPPDLTAGKFYGVYIVLFLILIYYLVYLCFECRFARKVKKMDKRKVLIEEISNNITEEEEDKKVIPELDSVDSNKELGVIEADIREIIDDDINSNSNYPAVNQNSITEKQIITATTNILEEDNNIVEKSDNKKAKIKKRWRFNFTPYPIYIYLIFIYTILYTLYIFDITYMTGYTIKYRNNGPYGPVITATALYSEDLAEYNLETTNGRNIFWHTNKKQSTVLCLSDPIDQTNTEGLENLISNNFIPKFTKVAISTGNILHTKVYNMPSTLSNTMCHKSDEILNELQKAENFTEIPIAIKHKSYHHAISLTDTNSDFDEKKLFYYRIPESYNNLLESDRAKFYAERSTNLSLIKRIFKPIFGKFYKKTVNNYVNTIEDILWPKFAKEKEDSIYILHPRNDQNNKYVLMSDIHAVTNAGYINLLRKKLNDIGDIRGVIVAGDFTLNGNSPIEIHVAFSNYVLGNIAARSIFFVTVGNHERALSTAQSAKFGQNLGLKQILQNNKELAYRLFEDNPDVDHSFLTQEQKKQKKYGSFDISSHQTWRLFTDDDFIINIYNIDSFCYGQSYHNDYTLDKEQYKWLEKELKRSVTLNPTNTFNIFLSHMQAFSMGPFGTGIEYAKQLETLMNTDGVAPLNLHYAGHDHLFTAYENPITNKNFSVNEPKTNKSFLSLVAGSAGTIDNMRSPFIGEDRTWNSHDLIGNLSKSNQVQEIKNSAYGNYHLKSRISYNYTILSIEKKSNNLGHKVTVVTYDQATEDILLNYEWDYSD